MGDLGEHSATIQGKSRVNPSNYSISYANGVLTVTPAPLAIAMDNQMKSAGDADPALTWAVTGGALFGSDVLSGSPTRAAGESAGNYAITGGTLGNSNYSLAVTRGCLPSNLEESEQPGDSALANS